MDLIECEVVVIGAGIVGLAIARELAQAGHEVIVLERERSIGSGISSRNSEVIHSGIYYPPGSLKAEVCVEGRHKLYAFCAERGIAHARCGKIIVAHDEADLAKLAALAEIGRRNGVADLTMLDARETLALEPELEVVGSLLSPSTGIVDSHATMLCFQGDFEAAGGAICFDAPVIAGEIANGVRLTIGGSNQAHVSGRIVINAAGLAAPRVAQKLQGFPVDHVPPSYFAKGSYFALQGRPAFRRLVYPLPEPGGLGVHATIDLAGRVRFGPDVQWTDDPDGFDVDPGRSELFYKAIRRYWPGLPDGALSPAYAGIRPKLSGPGEPAADFVIQDAHVHGVAGLINLFGIESPGLTASLAIAARVGALASR